MINLNKLLLESNKELNDNIFFILENEMSGLAINESGGVAAYPVIKDIIRLYNRINEIIKEEKDMIAPEIVNTKEFIDSHISNRHAKYVKARCHTIRIKIDDPAFNFKNLVNMPNSVFCINVYNIQETNPILAYSMKTRNKISNYNLNAGEYIDIENKEINTFDTDILNISVYAINDIVDFKYFISRFIHEFNHLFQDYNLLLKHNFRESDILNKQNKLLNDPEAEKLSDKTYENIKDLMYHLYSDTEINAYASGIFGELIAEHPDKNSYRSFLKRSETWEHVYSANCAIHELSQIDDNEMSIFKKLIDKYTIHKPLLNIKNLDTFRRKFIKDATERLHKFIKAIHNVAGYYFSVQEIFLLESMYTIPDETLWEHYKINSKKFLNEGVF